MEIQYQEINKLPVLVIKDAMDEIQISYVQRTLRSFNTNELLAPSETGTAWKLNGFEKKSNHGVFLDLMFENRGMCPLFAAFDGFYSKNLENFVGYHPLFEAITPDYGCLLSYYKNRDYYDTHIDRNQITSLYWYNEEPRSFEGGDLVLNEETTIEFERNTMVIFPGILKHEVTPVLMNTEDDGTNGRWCVSCFF